MQHLITITLWDSSTQSFVAPGLYKVKPDGLLHIGESEDNHSSFPFSSIKFIQTVSIED